MDGAHHKPAQHPAQSTRCVGTGAMCFAISFEPFHRSPRSHGCGRQRPRYSVASDARRTESTLGKAGSLVPRLARNSPRVPRDCRAGSSAWALTTVTLPGAIRSLRDFLACAGTNRERKRAHSALRNASFHLTSCRRFVTNEGTRWWLFVNPSWTASTTGNTSRWSPPPRPGVEACADLPGDCRPRAPFVDPGEETT